MKKIAILPMGSTEYHECLPLETDWLVAQALAGGIVKKLPKMQIQILPVIKKSPLTSTRDQPGSVSQTPEKFMKEAYTIAKRTNAKTIYFLPGHMGRIMNACMNIIGEKICDSLHKDVFILDYTGAIPKNMLKQKKTVEHAGESEVSLMLVIAPRTVSSKYKKQPACYPKPGPHCVFSAFHAGHKGKLRWWGEPSLASVEKGRKIFDAITTQFAKVIKVTAK